MPVAFLGAGIAYLGTKSAKVNTVAAAQAHKLSRCPAYCCALKVKPDAFGKMFYLFFTQTLARAMVARNGTGQTGSYAFFKFFV
jgi:hypothetical protein